MTSRETKYYLCEYLRIFYILRVFFGNIFLKRTKGCIYYLKPNALAVFLTRHDRLWSKILRGSLDIKLLPKDLTTANDIVMTSLCQKTLVDVTYDIMSEFHGNLTSSDKSLLNFLGYRLVSVKNCLRLYIEREIALDIMNDLFLVELTRYLSKNPASIFLKTNLVLFIDNKSYWARFIYPHAKEKDVAFISIRKFSFKRNKVVQLVYGTFQLFAEYLCSFFRRKVPLSSQGRPKIGVPYYVHSNFTNFFDKRNYYLFWYPELEIEPERIVIYSDGNMDIPYEEAERIKRFGFRFLSCNRFLRRGANVASAYKCSFNAIRLFFNYGKQLICLLRHVRTRIGFEEWKMLAVLFVKLPYWEDFFRSENIKVKFRFHDIFSHRDIAARLAGSVTTSYHYSDHSSDNFDIVHQDICDVYFVWGEKHYKCILPQYSDIHSIVHTGYIFDYTFDFLKKRSEQLRNTFTKRGINFVVTVVDETIAYPFVERILRFYKRMFEFLIENPDVGLLIKPKKDTRSILASYPEIFSLLVSLENEGRLKVLDSSKYPVEAGKASDLVIGIYADSTAALECSLAGVPTIVYECCSGERESNPYHKYGKNKIVFFDIPIMLDAIKKYKMNGFGSDGFADWSHLLKERDSFMDGNANKRMGCYIKTLLGTFEAGSTRDYAIERADQGYRKAFGQDKVVFPSANVTDCEVAKS